jgi:hypothetical protein
MVGGCRTAMSGINGPDGCRVMVSFTTQPAGLYYDSEEDAWQAEKVFSTVQQGKRYKEVPGILGGAEVGKVDAPEGKPVIRAFE